MVSKVFALIAVGVALASDGARAATSMQLDPHTGNIVYHTDIKYGFLVIQSPNGLLSLPSNPLALPTYHDCFWLPNQLVINNPTDGLELHQVLPPGARASDLVVDLFYGEDSTLWGIPVIEVPEPSTFTVGALGSLALATLRRRK